MADSERKAMCISELHGTAMHTAWNAQVTAQKRKKTFPVKNKNPNGPKTIERR